MSEAPKPVRPVLLALAVCVLLALPGITRPSDTPALADDEATTAPAGSAASALPASDLAADGSKARPGDTVFIIPVEGEIENGLNIVLNRAISRAEAKGARAVVLEMHTPGGRVDSAMKIRDRLVRTHIPTYTYVDNMAISAGAFIALATETIVMAPGSNIGGALPITAQPVSGEAESADNKFISIFASEMRKTAKFRGHPVDIAEAFCNPDSEIPGVKEKGEILTLDYDDATSLGLAAYTADSIEEVLEREGLGMATVERFSLTPTDRVARFLSSTMITSLLLILGLGGLFLEIKSPGVGLPGAVGVAALALFFWGANLASLSGYIEVIAFVLGVGLVIAEIYVIPGFGVPGILGIALMAGSVFFALFNMAPEGFEFSLQRLHTPTRTMGLSALIGTPLMILMLRVLPETAMFRRLALEAPVPATAGRAPDGARAFAAAAPSLAGIEVGMTGTALTTLRPSGTARIGERRVDVTSEGDYIDPGRTVRVLHIEGNKVVVRAVETP